jgi:hypothetical protein
VLQGVDAYPDDAGWTHARCDGQDRVKKIAERREAKREAKKKRSAGRKRAAARKAAVTATRPDGKRATQARFEGRCPLCPRPVAVGDWLDWDDTLHSWAHKSCL